MHFSFQDYNNLYLVLDYLKGGDLRYQLYREKKFSEEAISKYFLFKNFLLHVWSNL